jgi:hypothetical protein
VSNGAAGFNGPLTLWRDKQTLFMLKSVLRDTSDTRVARTCEVMLAHYNPELPESLFTFVPPCGASSLDSRPQPAPKPDQFQPELARLAGQVDYPVFQPTRVPLGLVPRQPRDQPPADLRTASHL